MTEKERLLNQYSDWLQMRNYSPSTYKAYMGTIRSFWKYCETKKGDENFDKSNAITSYLGYRKRMGMDYSTINGDYSSLQWFYKYVLNREWNVRKLIRPRREKRLPQYLSPSQVNKLVEETFYKKYKVIILLMYSTGIRLSEMRHLKWEHIKYDDGLIHIEKGKGFKDRIVILHDEMSKILKEYRTDQREEQEYLFEGRRLGRPIAPNTVFWALRRSREKAGLPCWVTSHVLRHSFATNSLKNGTDLLTLKELLGHKNITTTLRYVHLSKAHLKQSHNPLTDQCLSVSIKAASRNLR